MVLIDVDELVAQRTKSVFPRTTGGKGNLEPVVIDSLAPTTVPIYLARGTIPYVNLDPLQFEHVDKTLDKGPVQKRGTDNASRVGESISKYALRRLQEMEIDRAGAKASLSARKGHHVKAELPAPFPVDDIAKTGVFPVNLNYQVGVTAGADNLVDGIVPDRTSVNSALDGATLLTVEEIELVELADTAVHLAATAARREVLPHQDMVTGPAGP